MNPRLYAPETTAFQNNGIGVLTDAVSCYVTSGMGTEELTLKYPVTGAHFSDIALRSIILAKPEAHRDPQPYRVYKLTKPLSGIVTVYARHLCYDLMGVAIKPFSATNAALALSGLKENAVVDCPFEFWTDKATTASFSVPVPTSVWQALAGVDWSILASFGGEYVFDGSTVRLYGRRGADRGVSIRYGKNLTSLEQDENCAACYTGILPYWADSETGAVRALEDFVVNAPGEFGYTRILPVDFSSDFTEGEPTPEQLRTMAERYIAENKVGTPAVSWKVSFAQLEQAEEYRGQGFLERVSMGDSVSVYFPAMAIAATARVVSAKFDVLLDRFESVTLGSVKQSLASTIASQQKEIGEKISGKDVQTVLSAAIQGATGTILGAKGGSVRILDTDGDEQNDTLYIADNPDPEKATKVWRYNYEGWGASKNGYAGPFQVAATLENGIVADMITSGVLNANLIRTGTIQSTNGSFAMDLDTGDIRITSVDDRIQGLENSLPGQILQDMMESEEWATLQQEITEIRATAQGVEIEISGTTTNLNNFLEEFHTYFQAKADGLHISMSDSEFETMLGNDKLSFLQSGNEVAYIQYNRLYITEAWVEQGLAIGSPDGGSYVRMYVDGNGVWCVQIMGGDN